MAFLPAAFDANTVQPAAELGALPAGEYIVAITDSALEFTKAGDGQFLKLVFSVLEGPQKGAKVFDRLNLVNRNQTAVEIAQRALSAICHAVGVMAVTQSEQLHDRPLKIKVSYEPPKDGYGEQNRIKAYKPVHEGAPAAPLKSVPRSPTAKAAPQPAPAMASNAYREAKGGNRPSESAVPPWRQPKPKDPQEPAPAAQTPGAGGGAGGGAGTGAEQGQGTGMPHYSKRSGMHGPIQDWNLKQEAEADDLPF